MINIVIIEQGCMNDLNPPSQVCVREGLVLSFGQIIILVESAEVLTVLGDMSWVECWS